MPVKVNLKMKRKHFKTAWVEGHKMNKPLSYRGGKIKRHIK